MALADICSMQNFDLRQHENLSANDVFKFGDNFTNNLELAVPPFSNVSMQDTMLVFH